MDKCRIPLLFYAGGQQYRVEENTDEICPSLSHLYNRVQRQCYRLDLDQTPERVCPGTVGTCAVDCEKESPAQLSPYHHTNTPRRL